jgi:hypothetical protein
MSTLPAGLIFQIAADAGLVVRGKGNKRTLKCPFHDERNASAFLSTNNVFGCSVCHPGTAITAKEFCINLGRDWKSYTDNLPSDRPLPKAVAEETPFTPADAQATWTAARARMLDDEFAEADADPYEYLRGRGLGEAFDLRLYGILGSGMSLPQPVAAWHTRGYQIVVPLYDQRGEIACVQARNIRGSEPKTLAPKGSRMAGTVFANEAAIALLRGEPCQHDTVILCEGLTDFLAVSCAMTIPVFGAPGTSNAASAIGPWAKGRTLISCLDWDEAGHKATPAVWLAAEQHGVRRARSSPWPKRAKDACDVVAERGVEGLATCIKKRIAKEWK